MEKITNMQVKAEKTDQEKIKSVIIQFKSNTGIFQDVFKDISTFLENLELQYNFNDTDIPVSESEK